MNTHFQNTLEELGHYAIPILAIQKHTLSPHLVGTGTLYRMNSDVFLITAKHVVDGLEDRLIVTTGKDGFIRFAADMAAYEYRKGSGRDHDICIARIAPEVIDNLHDHLKLVETNQISVIDPYNKLTFYAFVGYPYSKNKPKPKSFFNNIRMKPYYYVVRDLLNINEISAKDKSDHLHVAFNAPFNEFRDVNLQGYIQPPKPHGVSGCGVWKIILNKATGQIDQLALVAVGIEYLKKDNAFIATRLQSAIMAIMEFKKVLNKDRQADSEEPRR